MNIHDKLALIIKELGLKKASFSNALNIHPTIIHNIVEGRRTKPSFDVLSKILLTFNNINANWLFRDEGNPFLDRPYHSDGDLYMLPENHDWEYATIVEEAAVPAFSTDMIKRFSDMETELREVKISMAEKRELLQAREEALRAKDKTIETLEQRIRDLEEKITLIQKHV